MEKNYPVSSKNKVPFIFLFFALFFITKISLSQTYCAAVATYTADDEIYNVTLGTLNNSSTCSTTGGPGSFLNAYSNYTAIPAPILTQGGNYPFSVTIGMCGLNSYSGIAAVWIDYNQNGSFTDPGENIFTSPYTAFSVGGTVLSIPGGITIPFTALPGTTRMRVIEDESSAAPLPCSDPTWGEVEDYNVTIVVPPPLDLGISALINPSVSKKCFTNDTIVARIKNYGSSIVDFSVNSTTLTVKSSGPIVATYTLALNTGTLASNASLDYTVSVNYNLVNSGVYKLKTYTTVIGDGSALNDTTNLIVTRSPYFTTSVFPDDTLCLGIPVQLNTNYDTLIALGTGNIINSSTTYPAPYGNFYMGAKHQFLFLASELTAAGIVAGNINSLSFNAINLNGTDPLVNLNIGIANTALSNLTTFQQTGFTTYYSSPLYTPTLGQNTHNFSTPFVWNGTSNIIIETCFNNQPTLYTSNVSFSQSSTTFTSSVWVNNDNNPSICSNTITSGFLNQRPNVWFGQTSSSTSYSWSPSIELSASNIYNPIANLTTTRTYTVTSNNYGCISNNIITIDIKPTPTPDLGNDSLFCGLPVVLNANTIANSYLWNTGSINSNVSVTSSGKYWLQATNTNGCTNTDTILVTVGVSPIVALGPDTAFCQGSTINLYVSNGSNNSYLWNTGATTTSITVGTTGSYSIIATHTSGCQSSDIINVTSKAKPTVALTFAGQTAYCVDDNVNRVLTEGTPSGGIYIGASVTSNTFNTTQAGQGSHIILYSYTGPNGCSNIAKDTLTVNACVGVEELAETIGLNVYPNPTTGVFTLELSASADVYGTLNITSIDGKIVLMDKVEGAGLISKSINISDLANGIYYLKVETKDAVRTYKVLKQ